MIVYIIYLIVCIVALGGIVCLQIYLSKQPSKWPGLLLPGITLILSIVVLLSFSLFSAKIEEKVKNIVLDETGAVVSESVVSTGSLAIEGRQTPVDFFAVLPLFLLCNIPTLGLLLIYFVNRKIREQQEPD